MNTFAKSVIAGAVAAAAFCGIAHAAPLIVDSHNSQAGPRYEALVGCLHSVQNSPNMGRGLALSPRVSYRTSAAGKVLILHGTTWENGVRVPIAVSCTPGVRGQIASVNRLPAGAAVATAR